MLDVEIGIALRQRYSFVFGLRGFPGDTFRVNALNSYMSDGILMIYTDRWDAVKQLWVDFAKATESELEREMVRL